MTEHTPLERLVATGALSVLDDEGNVAWDREKLFRVIQENPELIDDYSAVFGEEAAAELSAAVAGLAEPGNWISRWWRCGVAFASAISIAWIIWLATDHWPIIYTARIVWRFFVKLVL